MEKYFDVGSLVVIGITFFLFVLALLVKGATHDLLLEAGVFLVSVKLIMMGYKTKKEHERIFAELQAIRQDSKKQKKEQV